MVARSDFVMNVRGSRQRVIRVNERVRNLTQKGQKLWWMVDKWRSE